MFESVIRAVLNKFLGDYVANLEANQLNVGIFSGNVQLHGLKLKREALDKLNLPIIVHDGYLGKLELQIPWTNLKQQPVVVTISDLFILAGPKIFSSFDEKEEMEREFKSKMERLETHELFALDASLNANAASKVQQDTSNDSFATQLVTKIVDNLQVTIKNIHIRYEDDISHPEKELFSVGITLEELSATSTDHNWVESFIEVAMDRIHKMVKLEGFSLYWDSWSKMSFKNLNPEEFLAKFLETVRFEENRNQLLKRISGFAKLIVSKRRIDDSPKVQVELFFDQFAIMFDDSQYFDMLTLANFFVMSSRLHQYRALRPIHESIKENPLSWFRYAAKAHLGSIQDAIQKRSWRYILERRRDRLSYIEHFIKKLKDNSYDDPQFQLLQRKIPYEDLKYYRVLARKDFIKEQQAQQQNGKESGGWFSWLLSPSVEAKPSSFADLIQEEDLEQLYDTIDFHGIESNEQYFPNKEIIRLDFNLGTVSLNVGKVKPGRPEIVNRVAGIVFRHFSGSFIKRSETIRFLVDLQEIFVVENLLENSLFPEVIKSRSSKVVSSEDDDSPFLHLDYDQLTSNPDADASLKLTMKPLSIVVNHQAASLFKSFILGGRNKDLLDNLLGLAADQIAQFRVWTKSSLEHAISSHKSLDLYVDIQAPLILIPLNCASPNEFTYFLDLGHIKVRSQLVSTEQKSKILSSSSEALSRVHLHEIKHLLYDTLIVSLESLQILYFDQVNRCLPYFNTQRDLDQRNCDSFVVDKVDLSLTVGTCILPTNTELPEIKIRGHLPTISVSFSDEKYKAFMKLIDILILSSLKTKQSPIPVSPSLASLSLGPELESALLVLPTKSDQTDDGDDDEFQDAVENPEDLLIQEKSSFDVTSIDMTFTVDHVRGKVLQKIGTQRNIGEIEIESLKVLIENRPFDIVVKTYLKSFRMYESLGPEPHILLDGKGTGEADGLLAVVVTLVNPAHPLYKSKYHAAGISVDVDISSIRSVLDPPTIFTIIRYVVDTFPLEKDTQEEKLLSRNQSRLERSFSKLSKSVKAAISTESSSDIGRILVNVKMMEMIMELGPASNCIGHVNLRRAVLGVVYQDNGKILVTGKLTSFDVLSEKRGIGPYTKFQDIPFITVDGESVVNFSYETFVDPSAADFPGWETALHLQSGSLNVHYMPQFMRGMFDLLADLREATAIVTRRNEESEFYDTDQKATKFHYEIDIMTPIITIASPQDPDEKLVIYPGNLHVFNSFKPDKENCDLWDTFIDLNLRAVHIDIWHHHSPLCPLQLGSFMEPTDIDVRITQAHTPLRRDYAPVDVEVSLGVIKLCMGQTEFTLAMNLLNWFVATQSSVMDKINRFLSAGNPSSIASSPKYDPDVVTIEVQILIDCIEMAIFNYQVVVPEAPPDYHPISNLVFADFEAHYANRASGSFSFEAKSMKMSMTDTRSDPERCFRSILSAGTCLPKDAPMLLFHYEKLQETQQIVKKLSVDSSQILLVLDHLFSMKVFFVDGLPSSELFQDPDAQAHNERMSAGMATLFTNSTLLAAVRSCCYILENPYDKNSRSIEIKLPYVVYTDNEGKSTLVLDNSQLAFCRMDMREESRLSFVEPFNIQMISESDHLSSSSIDVLSKNSIVISPIVMRFSYQDLSMFQSLFSQFSSLNEQKASAQASSSSIDNLDDCLNEAVQIMIKVPSGSPQSTPSLPSRTKSVYSLEMESFRAVFVDDFSQVSRPFIEWLISGARGEFTAINTDPMVGSAHFDLRATYFNVSNSHWEPLLEPVKLQLDMSQISPMEDPSKKYNQLTLSSEEGLEFDVSHYFMDQIYQFSTKLQTLSENGELMSPQREKSAMPYVIHNHAGVKIEFWPSQTSRSNVGPIEDRILVSYGEEVPWTYQDWKTLRSSTDSITPKLNCFIVDGPFEPVSDISIDTTGTFGYPLRPKINGRSLRLVVEIEVINGIKHIWFRPSFTFVNDGKFPIEIFAEGMSETDAITIPSGKSAPLPLSLPLHACSIKVRPGGLGYDWCEQSFMIAKDLFVRYDEDSSALDVFHVSCNHLTDTALHPPFYYCLYGVIQKGSLEDGFTDGLPNTSVIGRIHFRAPLQFMNQLPYRLNYRIYDRSCGFDFGAALVPGGVAQLHFINTTHIVGLTVEIEEADLRSTEITLVNDIELDSSDTSMTLIDSNRLKIELSLAYKLTKGGSRRVIIYSPYLVYNLTGLNFGLKNNNISESHGTAGLAKCNQVRRETGLNQPLMFSFTESLALRDRIKVRVCDSEWSMPVSMEAIGAVDYFDVFDDKAGLWYNLALTVRLGSPKLRPCKVVQFVPRFIVVNNTSIPFFIFDGSNQQVICEPSSQTPFHCNPERKHLVSLQYSDLHRTSTFSVEQVGKIFLKAEETETGLFRVDRHLQGSTIFVAVKEELTWPFHFINDSTFDLMYNQSKWSDDVKPNQYALLPNERVDFSWDEPSATEKQLIIEAGNGKKIPIDIYDIGQLRPVMVKLPGGVKKSLSIDIVADGPVLQVIFRDFDAKNSLFQYRRQSLSMASTVEQTEENFFEIKQVSNVISSCIRLVLPSIGITLINRYLEEVLYCYAKDIELRYAISNLHYTYGMTIGWLQFDNQLFDNWDHPILLYPAEISKKAQFKRGTDDEPPFLSLAIIQSVDSAHGVKYFKYFGFLLQEVVIDLGEHLMNKLVDFFQFTDQSESGGVRCPVSEADGELPNMIKLDTESDLLYFELFQMHPIKVNLTFSKLESDVYDENVSYSQQQQQHQRFSGYNPVEAMASAFTTVMGSISNAPLRFNTLLLEHPIVRQNVLKALIQRHYMDQAFSQIHRVIGSADFIGNPIGLFNTFGSGVSDFFYEPLLGLVSDRPGDIGIGLAKGSLSLVRKTVVGVTDTVAKFTGSISKGATLFTFDPAFQQKRRIIRARNKPKHALGGVVASAKHLISGVTSGLTGIVEKPVEGAKEDGFGGFIRGIGVGVIGAVVKPIVGVMDATTSLTEGIRNTADSDGTEVSQIRLPRAVPYDQIIYPYSDYTAKGQSILYYLHLKTQDSSASRKMYAAGRREYYVAHLAIPADESIALVTTCAIFLLTVSSSGRSYYVTWRIPLERLVYARPYKDVVLLVVRMKDVKQRMLFIADAAEQEWICQRIEQALSVFNELRRTTQD